MSLISRLESLPPKDRAAFGAARAQDAAFDAVKELWDRRKAEGMRQTDLVNAIGRDAGWVSKALSGPANWTMKTFGELVIAMRGEVVIKVAAMEDHLANEQAKVESRTPLTREEKRPPKYAPTPSTGNFIGMQSAAANSFYSTSPQDRFSFPPSPINTLTLPQ